MTNRRTLIKASLAAASTAALPRAFAQADDWPKQSVRIIVPFSAGGASDVLTRLIAERLQAKFGQQFVVENRTGAGGNIGMEAVQKAAPDGYTIASATIGTLTINEFLFAKLPYDPVKDFAYVSTIWENTNVLVVPTGHPAKTLKEFLAWAKAQPQGVTFSSSGVGTTPHLSGELFCLKTGIKGLHIPFRGAAQSMPEVISGNVNFAIDNIASWNPMLKAGKARALAVTSDYRWPTLMDVPTMSEAGVPDIVITSWGAFVVPAGTPATIVNKLSAAIREFAADPAQQQRFLGTGARSVSATPQELTAFAARERIKWKEVVRVSGAKAE